MSTASTFTSASTVLMTDKAGGTLLFLFIKSSFFILPDELTDYINCVLAVEVVAALQSFLVVIDVMI